MLALSYVRFDCSRRLIEILETKMVIQGSTKYRMMLMYEMLRFDYCSSHRCSDSKKNPVLSMVTGEQNVARESEVERLVTWPSDPANILLVLAVALLEE